MNMETLLSFIPDLPSSWIHFIIFGTNKKKIWSMEAKEDCTIIVNKYRHRTIRQVEFIIRVLFFGTILYFLNDIYLERILNNLFILLFKSQVHLSRFFFLIISLCFILSECVLTTLFYTHYFRQGLIGIDMSSGVKNKLNTPIVITNIGVFIWTYIRLININTVILFKLYSVCVLLYCCHLYNSMKKHEIFRFFSGSRFSSTENPLLHKDIYLNFKTGKNKHKKINLLENNLYICDNDDILILSKKGEKEIIRKENIESLQIKNDFIIYKNNEWIKQKGSV